MTMNLVTLYLLLRQMLWMSILSFLNINANSVNLVKIYSNGVDKGKLLVHCSNNHYSTVEWKKKPQVQLEPSSKIVKYTPDELHALVKFGRLSRKKTEKPFSSLDLETIQGLSSQA